MGCVEAPEVKVLLDTCTIVWAVAAPDELSAKARSALEDPETESFYCPMSCAETAWAVARKRISLDRHWKLWFRHYVEMSGWECLPIDLDIVEEACSVPEPLHADPVHRLLVAMARIHDLHLTAGDAKSILYPHVRIIW